MTSQIEQQASNLQGHLPECLTTTYDAEAWCICDRLRACQQRVLDAAIGVVVTWQADRALPPFTALLAALNALREQPADQTGYKPPDAP